MVDNLKILMSIRLGLWLLILSLFLSCKDNALFDSGPTVTREVTIAEYFSSIDIENMFDITLVQDTVKKVLVTCGKNLQSYVSVSVKDSILVLDHNAKYNWSRKYEKIKLEVHLIVTPHIDIYEPVNLKTRGILKGGNFILKDWGRVSEVDISLDVNSCELYMASDNFGYFKIKGKSSSAYFEGWGTCQVRADSLILNYCHVKHRGMGNVYVNVTGQLIVSLEFTGNVCYTGNPSQIVIEQQKSSGQLINMQH
jgi:hypothetical protein